ncbi:MAG: helix-turn-helix transcriptional regulator [Rhodovibrionaceae bacterium]
MAPRSEQSGDKRDFIYAVSEEPSDGQTNAWHVHDRGCLIYPSTGVVSVETAEGHWVVPAQRAVWVPAGVSHQTRVSGKVALRSLMIEESFPTGLPPSACVIGVTPLLRELILYVCGEVSVRVPDAPARHALAVIADQLREVPTPALPLPLPEDPRLKRIAEALLENPADNRTLEAWGRSVGASGRTLRRLFQAETAMGFRAWRQHLRVLEALRRIAQGEAVTNVALDVGFDSAGAFAQMFKKILGVTPSKYF